MRIGRNTISALTALGLAAGIGFGAYPAAAGEAEPQTAGDDTVIVETEGDSIVQDSAGKSGEVTVTASGSVMEVPDMAQITLSVVTDGTDADSVQSGNTKTVMAVTQVLSGLGVEDESIQTSAYSISPQYDYDESPAKLTGYEASTTLTVSDQKISETGQILAECVKAGATSIDSVVYTCSTYDEKYQEALTKAVEAAGKKAETLAEAAGGSLGEVLSVTEGYQDLSARYKNAEQYDTAALSSSSAESMTAGPDLNPGSLEIQAQVTVTYEIVR